MSEDLLRETIATLEQLLAVHEDIAATQGQRLRAEHLRKAAIVEASLDGIVTIDDRGVITEFSRSAATIFGFTPEEAIGRNMADLIIPPELRQRHHDGMERFFETGSGPVLNERIQITAIRKDGTRFPVELAVVPGEHEGETFFTGHVRDITEQTLTSDRLANLQRWTDTALNALTLDRLLPELLDRIGEILDPDTISIMLIGEDGLLRVEAGRGLDRALGRTVAFGEGVAGRAAQMATPVRGTDRGSDTDGDGSDHAPTITSRMAVPLVAGGTTLGVVEVGSSEPRDHTDDEVDLLQRAADRIAIAVEHARSFEREQRIAQTLQMSLLPDAIPLIPGVDVAVRYLPAGDGTRVGGDWYDVIALPDGKIGFAIGDVVGRGVRAAAVMGEHRNAVRAYSIGGALPDEVITRVDHLIRAGEAPEMATLLYLILDPATGEVTYGSAGHPPALLVSATGEPSFLEGGKSVPLGVGTSRPFERAEAHLARGSTLVMYTDGLIERRGEDLQIGLDRLAASVSDPLADAHHSAETILRAHFPDELPKDDVAFVVVRSTPIGSSGFERTVRADPRELAGLRAGASRWFHEIGLADAVAFDLAVALNEAASNAIEHAYGPQEATFEVEATFEDSTVTLIVRDHGRWRKPRPAHDGRGITLMKGLADDVVISSSETGTEVVITRAVQAGSTR